MAEVVGLAMGSLQLIDVVLKLKGTFDGVENLPQRVTDLLQEAEIIATQLSAIETELARDPAGPPESWDRSTGHFNMTRCVQYCRQALRALYDLAVAFESKLGRQKGLRRGIVMANLFLHKDQLEKLQHKLDRAVQLLKWAQSCYVQAQLSHLMQMSRSQHHVVLSAITTLQPAPDSPDKPAQAEKESKNDDQNGPTAYAPRASISTMSKSRVTGSPSVRSWGRGTFRIESAASGYTLQVQLPEWISKVVWEMQAHRACTAYTYHLRQYRYRSLHDPFYRGIFKGQTSVAMLREMFDKGQASPFDIEKDNGFTLQHMALSRNNIEMSKFLMSLGLGLDVVDNLGEYPMPRSYSEDLPTIGLHSGEDLDVLGSEPTFIRAVWSLGTYWGQKRLPRFRKYRDWLFPNYDDLPLLARLLIARYMVNEHLHEEVFRGETLRFSLSAEGAITPAMVEASISENLSLLHTFTVAFAAQSFHEASIDGNVTDVQLTLKHLIITSSDIHHRERVSFNRHYDWFRRLEHGSGQCTLELDPSWPSSTPFLTLMRIAAGRTLIRGLYSRKRRVWKKSLDALTRRWVSLLVSCGVDLQAYGAREHALIFTEGRKELTSGSVPTRLTHSVEGKAFHHIYYHLNPPPDPITIYLKDFTYGPDIQDWSVEWELEPDIDLNIFWFHVEQEEREQQKESKRKREAPVYGPLGMPGGWVEEEEQMEVSPIYELLTMREDWFEECDDRDAYLKCWLWDNL